MTNKAQQDLLNQLNEYQTRQLDEIPNILKKGISAVGAVPGAFKGAGQKVAGATKRFGQDVKKAYTGGREGAAKKIAGQDYKAPASKAQAQTQVKQPGLLKRAAGAVSTGIGKVDAFAQKALDKVDDASNYNPYKDNPIGDRSQQTYTGVGGAQIGQNAKSSNLTQKNQAASVGAGLQKADAEAQRKAGLEKKLGTTGAAATATNTVKTATDKSIARNQKKNAKQKTGGISQGIKNATMVPTGVLGPDGKMTMRPAIDKNKDGKDDKNGKPISKTATDVKNKANVKAGGVQLDPNNPEHKALISAIEKASPGLTKTVNKLDTGSKSKLLKGLQVA